MTDKPNDCGRTDGVLMKCRDCGVPMRPWKQKSDGSTAIARRTGWCEPCSKAAERGQERDWSWYLDRAAQYEPTKTPIKVDPVLWAAFAEDREAAQKEKRRQQQWTQPCTAGCGRTTRPSNWAADRAPGTVLRVSGGMCQSCWRKAKAAV